MRPRELTDEKLKSDVSCSADKTYDKYLESVAKEKGVAVSDLDSNVKEKIFLSVTLLVRVSKA